MNVFENMIVLSLVYSFIIYMKCVALFFICSIFYNILRIKAFQINMYSLHLTSIYVNMFETMTVISLVYSFIMRM